MDSVEEKVHHIDDEQSNIIVPETAHVISQDSWLQAGFVLTTGLNSAYALGYSGTIMVSLGWIGGVVGLILAAAISLYANCLIAELHEIGGKRHIRYRDLAGHIYGRKAYSLTWGLQYVNLFMINTGYIILAGQSLKAVNVLYTDSHALKLPHFIAVSGLVCALFACAVPHLSALRVWLGVSAVLSLLYIVPTCTLSFRDEPISEPEGVEDFTEEAKKVINFASLDPPTKQCMLRPHLGEAVDYLFDEAHLSKTPRPRMTSSHGGEENLGGDTLPPLPRFGSRKRRAPPATGPAKVTKTGTNASAGHTSVSAIPTTSTAPEVAISESLSRSSSAHVTQTCGVMTSSTSHAVSASASGTGLSQASPSIGAVGSRPPRAPEGGATWKPVFKDLSGKHLSVNHHGRDNSPVAGLVQNNSILPADVDFFDKQTSAYLSLISAQSRYNVNAADHSLNKRLLRYEDYISSICESLGCTRADSIIGHLTKLKAEVEKSKDAFSRIAELQHELDKTKSLTSRNADLQTALDKAQAENVVAQATIDKLKADKEGAVKELVEANLGMAKERVAKEAAEGTIHKWRNDYTLAGKKINALFDAIAPHMESCRPFRDEVRPFFAKFEPEDLENFDRDTMAIDAERGLIQSPIVDKGLVTQSDDLVDITEAERRDAVYSNPDGVPLD